MQACNVPYVIRTSNSVIHVLAKLARENCVCVLQGAVLTSMMELALSFP